MSFATLLLAADEGDPFFSNVLFAAGSLLLVFFLLRRSYIHFGRRTRGGEGPPIAKQPRPRHAWDGAKQDADARFNQQQVELQELSRDLMGQLDSKMLLLQALITQSDERIARLETLLEGDRGMADRPAITDRAQAGEG